MSGRKCAKRVSSATGLQSDDHERPRAKLLEGRAAELSDSDLLSVLLHTGTRTRLCVDLARDVLRDLGGVTGLAGVSREGLLRKGVGAAKAASVLASLEVACRLARARVPMRDPTSQLPSLAAYLAIRYRRRDQEVTGAVYVDGRQRVIGERETFRGTLSRTAVEPRALLKEGLLLHATALLVFHTHPSGDPSPTSEDLAFARTLTLAAEAVGLELLDSLILGNGGAWSSLRASGDLY